MSTEAQNLWLELSEAKAENGILREVLPTLEEIAFANWQGKDAVARIQNLAREQYRATLDELNKEGEK